MICLPVLNALCAAIGKSAGTVRETTLAPGDTMSIPEGMQHTVTPSMTGEAALYRVLATQDPAGLTWTPNVINAGESE
jgi:hypothetical protein